MAIWPCECRSIFALSPTFFCDPFSTFPDELWCRPVAWTGLVASFTLPLWFVTGTYGLNRTELRRLSILNQDVPRLNLYGHLAFLTRSNCCCFLDTWLFRTCHGLNRMRLLRLNVLNRDVSRLNLWAWILDLNRTGCRFSFACLSLGFGQLDRLKFGRF